MKKILMFLIICGVAAGCSKEKKEFPWDVARKIEIERESFYASNDELKYQADMIYDQLEIDSETFYNQIRLGEPSLALHDKISSDVKDLLSVKEEQYIAQQVYIKVLEQAIAIVAGAESNPFE